MENPQLSTRVSVSSHPGFGCNASHLAEAYTDVYFRDFRLVLRGIILVVSDALTGWVAVNHSSPHGCFIRIREQKEYLNIYMKIYMRQSVSMCVLPLIYTTFSLEM